MIRSIVIRIVLLAALALILLLVTRFHPKIIKTGKRVIINNHEIQVEIADTPQLQTRGLSGRKSMAHDNGMLFVFAQPDYHYFWMKDMHFPLDFIWMRGETVIDLTNNVQPPAVNTAENKLPVFTSSSPADKVLEINAGIIREFSIKPGDKIKFLL